MPVVLSQHFSPADRVYADAEGSLYHYPRAYFNRIKPFDSFVYYRPLGETIARADSKSYFGYGVLGTPFPDIDRADHRFVPLIQYARFPHLVPLRDPLGNYYESGSTAPFQGQSAVRTLSDISFHRILAAAGVAVTGIAHLPSTDEVAAASYRGTPIGFPKDDLRRIREIPAGAGYRPQGSAVVDVYESAALQERARADHQSVLRLIAARSYELGSTCWYNNNIDLFVENGDERFLVEAKSLNDTREAVNRMRYGIGQLTDYSVRYKDDIGRARQVLAFGRPPSRDTSWIANVLQSADVAFVAAEGGRLIALNDAAQTIGFVQ